MSEEKIQKLIVLIDSIEEHRDMVAERITRAGMVPHPAIVDSIAKYWSALERLAAE